MKYPHAGKDNPADRNLIHHNEPHRHQKRHRHHDLNLCFPCHAPASYVAFQIVLIQFCPGKPTVQPFRTPGKTKRRKQEERESRQERKDCPQCPPTQRRYSLKPHTVYFKFHHTSPIAFSFWKFTSKFSLPIHGAQPSPGGGISSSVPKSA